MRTIYCLLLFLCPCLSKAQPLKVGDRVPPRHFSQMLSSPAARATLSSFKGKLILLDFWATWCGACLVKFPLLDSLQQAHAGKLQVVLINEVNTKDTKPKIEATLARLRKSSGRPLALPVVYNDTLAGRLFPHNMLPHYVWIGEDFTVLAITAAEDVTAANISAALNGRLPALLTKKDLRGFDRNQPLFSNGNGGNGQQIIQRSTFSSFISGLPAGSQLKKDSSGQTCGIIITNSSLYHLLLQAYRVNLPANQVFIKVSDSLVKARLNKDSASLRANRFCYELILPAANAAAIYSFMQQDIERSFALAATFRQQLLDCYVITADTARLQQFKSRGSTPLNSMYNKSLRCMQNIPFSLLPQYINSVSPLPVLDETGTGLPVDIDLHGVDFTNITALQLALQPYGISLSRQQRLLSSFIIYNN